MQDALITYGPLGIWVAVSVWRERTLVQYFEAERKRFDRERTQWLSVLGRKNVISDRTIMEITDDKRPD